jgi:DNA-directed RNA polymerase subunit M/transcription elongation factor TFIIS
MAHKSGDICTKCGRARLGVYASQCRGEYQTRYLRCPQCKATAKSVVPGSEIRRRTPVPK